MAMRAGQALRQKWAQEARAAQTERDHPGYHARPWRAHEMRGEVIRRYGNAMLASGMSADAVLPLLIEATHRVRVIDENYQPRVTARATQEG